jgi:citrate lyase subunit beta/citryl-CoA lyase
MRSKLFVPCSRPDFFAKALDGDADALSFDLEDSVPADSKQAARDRLIDLLGSDRIRGSTKRVIVRVNAQDTTFFDQDLAALAGLRVDIVNMPKADAPDAVRVVATRMEALGLAAGLLVNIETAKGVARAAEIASAHPRVIGLQAGLNDLFASLGIDRYDARHVHAALWSIRLAAGETSRFAYDGAWPDLGDEAGFRAEAELARSLGLVGKTCIHPRQVAIANAVFGDGPAMLAEARRIVAVAREAQAAGRGAFLLDGRMIDRAIIARAEALLAAEKMETGQ